MGKIILKKNKLINPTLETFKKILRQSTSCSPDERCAIIKEYENATNTNPIKNKEVSDDFEDNPITNKSDEYIEKIKKIYYEDGYDVLTIAIKEKCDIDFIQSIIFEEQSVIAKPYGNGKLRPNTKIIRDV